MINTLNGLLQLDKIVKHIGSFNNGSNQEKFGNYMQKMKHDKHDDTTCVHDELNLKGP